MLSLKTPSSADKLKVGKGELVIITAMPSNLIKVLLTLTSLSPALLLLYIMETIHNLKNLSIYLDVSSLTNFFKGTETFFKTQYLLILFLLFILLASIILRYAKRNFSIGRIEVKSIKQGDINFVSIISSVIPALVKIYNPDISDGILLTSFFLIALVISFTLKAAYHFNLILKLFFGYRHYEIQTKEEVTYLIISKKELINRKQITRYVKLADHMLLYIEETP